MRVAFWEGRDVLLGWLTVFRDTVPILKPHSPFPAPLSESGGCCLCAQRTGLSEACMGSASGVPLSLTFSLCRKIMPRQRLMHLKVLSVVAGRGPASACCPSGLTGAVQGL